MASGVCAQTGSDGLTSLGERIAARTRPYGAAGGIGRNGAALLKAIGAVGRA